MAKLVDAAVFKTEAHEAIAGSSPAADSSIVAQDATTFNVYYNFGRIHKTLRVTPAMAAGVSDHVWSMEEVVALIDENEDAPKKRGPYKKRAP